MKATGQIPVMIVLCGLLSWNLSAAHEPPGHHEAGRADQRRKEPVRITMEELHRHGGIPPGWKFTMPAGDPQAGRAVFIQLECYSCHHVQGEQFVARNVERKPGPDLTGMGSHHPPEYLAESILYPNAVIITAPGFTGEDGLSIHPSYADLITLQQWIDLVAYLKSLIAGHPATGAPH